MVCLVSILNVAVVFGCSRQRLKFLVEFLTHYFDPSVVTRIWLDAGGMNFKL